MKATLKTQRLPAKVIVFSAAIGVVVGLVAAELFAFSVPSEEAAPGSPTITGNGSVTEPWPYPALSGNLVEQEGEVRELLSNDYRIKMSEVDLVETWADDIGPGFDSGWSVYSVAHPTLDGAAIIVVSPRVDGWFVEPETALKVSSARSLLFTFENGELSPPTDLTDLSQGRVRLVRGLEVVRNRLFLSTVVGSDEDGWGLDVFSFLMQDTTDSMLGLSDLEGVWSSSPRLPTGFVMQHGGQLAFDSASNELFFTVGDFQFGKSSAGPYAGRPEELVEGDYGKVFRLGVDARGATGGGKHRS